MGEAQRVRTINEVEMDFFASRRFTWVLYTALALDALFIALHALYTYTELCPEALVACQRLKITRDRGYAEYFQYAKELVIVGALGLLASRKRSLLYGTWAVVFCYVLLDDAFWIHERWGLWLSLNFDFPLVLGLRTRDLGEFIVSAFFGSVFLIVGLVAYRRGTREAKRVSLLLVAMICGLVLFGIAVDLMHQMVTQEALYAVLSMVEDGGEHVVMSLILWLSILLVEREFTPKVSLAGSLKQEA